MQSPDPVCVAESLPMVAPHIAPRRPVVNRTSRVAVSRPQVPIESTASPSSGGASALPHMGTGAIPKVMVNNKKHRQSLMTHSPQIIQHGYRHSYRPTFAPIKTPWV